MDASELLKKTFIEVTNAYAVEHGIEPPILTDKVSDEALAAYRNNAGPDANARVELERMAKKAAMFDELLKATRAFISAPWCTAEYNSTLNDLYHLIQRARDLK